MFVRVQDRAHLALVDRHHDFVRAGHDDEGDGVFGDGVRLERYLQHKTWTLSANIKLND